MREAAMYMDELAPGHRGEEIKKAFERAKKARIKAGRAREAARAQEAADAAAAVEVAEAAEAQEAADAAEAAERAEAEPMAVEKSKKEVSEDEEEEERSITESEDEDEEEQAPSSTSSPDNALFVQSVSSMSTSIPVAHTVLIGIFLGSGITFIMLHNCRLRKEPFKLCSMFLFCGVILALLVASPSNEMHLGEATASIRRLLIARTHVELDVDDDE